MSSRLRSTALALLCLASLLLPVYSHDLWLPDEPRVAHTAYECGRSGGFLLPTVNHEPFLQVPPLFFWLLGGWLHLFGPSDANARLLSVVFSAGTLLLVAHLAGRFYGARAGVLAPLILLGTTQFWEVGHRVVVETALAFFLASAFVAFILAAAGGGHSRRGACVCGLSVGAAFLVKGLPEAPWFAGVVVAYRCFVPRLGWAGRPGRFLVLAAVSALAVILPWVVAMLVSHRQELRELTVDHVVRRVAAGGVKNPSNFDFLHRTALNLAPWVAFLPWVLRFHVENVRNGARLRHTSAALDSPEAAAGVGTAVARARLSLLLLLWMLLPLVFLLLSRSKRQVYLLPLFPAAAMLTASWLDLQLQHPRAPGILRRVASALALVTVAGLGVLVVQAGSHSWGVLLLAGVVVLLAGASCCGQGPRKNGFLFLDFIFGSSSVAPPSRNFRVEEQPAAEVASVWARRTLALVVASVALWGTVYHLGRNADKSVAEFGRRLADYEDTGYEVVGFELSEREVGAVAWYLKHPFRVVERGQSFAPGGAGARRRLLLVCEAGARESIEASGSFGEEIPFADAEVVLERSWRRRTLQALASR